MNGESSTCKPCVRMWTVIHAWLSCAHRCLLVKCPHANQWGSSPQTALLQLPLNCLQTAVLQLAAFYIGSFAVMGKICKKQVLVGCRLVHTNQLLLSCCSLILCAS